MSTLSEPNSVENFVLSSSDDNRDDSSNSENFAKTWPDTHQDTFQFVKDTQIDVKKHQLERNEAEMQADIVEQESTLQTEIREITAEITELRVEIGSLEKELSDVQEKLKTDIIDVTKESSEKLHKYQSIVRDDEPIIEQLKSAIQAQRENHERNKDLAEMRKKEINLPLDYQIQSLMSEIELMRKSIINTAKRGEKNISDAESSTSLINVEIESIATEIQKLNNMKQKAAYTLSALKRELIINEEIAASMRSQIDKASMTRNKIKSILDRSQVTLWKSQTSLL
ncbi:hypothetical protein M9Y10_043197 [Tritrichomonas musculus]|uniref:Uncharacterized protein n=1 Tax=Tritrichomonas musculus TaxID=1915356 RepID=A0ABR2JZ12_9EUKA